MDDPDTIQKYIVIAQSVINGVRQRAPFGLDQKDSWVIYHKVQSAGSSKGDEPQAGFIREEYAKIRLECTNLLERTSNGGRGRSGGMMNVIKRVFQGSAGRTAQPAPSIFATTQGPLGGTDDSLSGIVQRYPLNGRSNR